MAALKKRNDSELLLRGFSGICIVAVILTGIWFGNWIWFGVVAAFTFLSLSEYYKMLALHYRVSKGIGYIAAFAVFYSSAEGLQPVSIALTLSFATFLILIVEILRRQIGGESFAIWNVGGTISGILYIVVPWSFMLLLRAFPAGPVILFSLFCCTWGCDVCAYLVGSRWGRAKLCERISPNKTWEGFFGGLAGSMVVGSLLIFFLQQRPFPLFWIAVICGTLGQLGDLAESLLKREAGIKDAGSLIPGHGGVLDRFDSILISGLMTYVLYVVIYP
jgi:phosphatidate cytidylyltransferase